MGCINYEKDEMEQLRVFGDDIQMITMNGYHTEAMKNKVYGYGSEVNYPILGLLGEAGELANKYKKVIRDDNGILSMDKREALIDELGDVLWYATALADDLGISLGEVAQRNYKKLKSRRERGVLKGSGDNR
jgi:NTP pyrophosphatase (non-canonical NTP hydrolase)